MIATTSTTTTVMSSSTQQSQYVTMTTTSTTDLSSPTKKQHALHKGKEQKQSCTNDKNNPKHTTTTTTTTTTIDKILLPKTLLLQTHHSENNETTLLPDLQQIAKTLHTARPFPSPTEIMKFLSIDLATCTSFTNSTGVGVLSGYHSKEAVEKSVERYIQLFLRCTKCQTFETKYDLRGLTGGGIYLDCGVCGCVEEVTGWTDHHSLCHYILSKKGEDQQQEDQQEEEEEKNKVVVTKKEWKGETKQNSITNKNRKQGRTRRHLLRKRKERQRKEGHDHHDDDDTEDDMADEDDTTICSDSEDDDYDDFSLDPQESTIQNLKSYLQNNPNATPSTILSHLFTQTVNDTPPPPPPTLSYAKHYNPNHVPIYTFIQSAITPFFFQNNECHKYAPILTKLTESLPELELVLIEACVLKCLENDGDDVIMPKKSFGVLLKQFYDLDVLNEDVILSWAASASASGGGGDENGEMWENEDSRANLKRVAQPFLTRLQETLEESTDDDDDDSFLGSDSDSDSDSEEGDDDDDSCLGSASDSDREGDDDDEEECHAKQQHHPSTATATTNQTTSTPPSSTSSSGSGGIVPSSPTSVQTSKLMGSISWCDTSLEDSDDDYLLHKRSPTKRTRVVTFMENEVSGVKEIPRITSEDWSSLFYTCHEIQRMHDEYRQELEDMGEVLFT